MEVRMVKMFTVFFITPVKSPQNQASRLEYAVK